MPLKLISIFSIKSKCLRSLHKWLQELLIIIPLIITIYIKAPSKTEKVVRIVEENCSLWASVRVTYTLRRSSPQFWSIAILLRVFGRICSVRLLGRLLCGVVHIVMSWLKLVFSAYHRLRWSIIGNTSSIWPSFFKYFIGL